MEGKRVHVKRTKFAPQIIEASPVSAERNGSPQREGKKRWKRMFNVVRAVKDFQKVRFVVDPRLHRDLDEYPIPLSESTIDESVVHYSDYNVGGASAFCTQERLEYRNLQLYL